jgi:hypothetical protein
MIGFLKRLWRKIFPKKGRVVSFGGEAKVKHEVSSIGLEKETSVNIRRKRLKKRQGLWREMAKRNGQLY